MIECVAVMLVKVFKGVRTLGTAHSTGHHSQWSVMTELAHFYVITDLFIMFYLAGSILQVEEDVICEYCVCIMHTHVSTHIQYLIIM